MNTFVQMALIAGISVITVGLLFASAAMAITNRICIAFGRRDQNERPLGK